MRTIIAIASIAALLSACAPKTTTVVTTAPTITVTEPLVSPISVKPVEWKVMTRDEVLAKAAELEKNPDQKITLFVLTPKGFANLQSNMIDTKRYIREQKKVVVYYRTLTGK